MSPTESSLWKHFKKKGKEQNTFEPRCCYICFVVAILHFVFGLRIFFPKLNSILATYIFIPEPLTASADFWSVNCVSGARMSKPGTSEQLTICPKVKWIPHNGLEDKSWLHLGLCDRILYNVGIWEKRCSEDWVLQRTGHPVPAGLPFWAWGPLLSSSFSSPLSPTCSR